MTTDTKSVEDRREQTFQMEPLLVDDRRRGPLADLALELAQKAAGFRRSLPPSFVASLANLVRAMNCYYSNLIEGHDTHPVDIERALKNNYSEDKKKRDLQHEAIAHIAVQEWIDTGGLSNAIASTENIREVHRRFCEKLPDDLLWVEYPGTNQRIRVVPGELREHNVKVGRHIAISPGAVPRFLDRFSEVYGRLGKADTVLATAAAHHRLVWIHPFIDGNGRVARLMSHAMLLDTLDSGAIWSVARGLARSVDEYKMHLANCDLPRRNDLDGRGNLSEEALAEFTKYFLKTCIDQVDFMEGLVQPAQLRTRILSWVEEEVQHKRLSPKSHAVLEALLVRGDLPRADIPDIVDTGDRQARRIVLELTEKGVLTSDKPNAPLRLAFPAALASQWMPGLFPDQT